MRPIANNSSAGTRPRLLLVDDDETLGHFADWLEVSPQRLRNLNKLKARQAIHVGQALRLDFSKVTPEQFQERRLEYHKDIEEDFFGVQAQLRRRHAQCAGGLTEVGEHPEGLDRAEDGMVVGDDVLVLDHVWIGGHVEQVASDP